MYIISMVILRSEPQYVSWYVVVAIIFLLSDVFLCANIGIFRLMLAVGPIFFAKKLFSGRGFACHSCYLDLFC